MKNFNLLFCLFFFIISFPAISQEKIDLLILNKKYNEALKEIDRENQKSPSSELLFKKGTVYKLQQQYQNAAEAFFMGLEIEPQNALILEELAETLSTLDNHSDATAFFLKANQLNPGNLTLAGKLGASYINLKDYQNAVGVFEALYQKDSTNIYWNKQYAFCLAKIRANDSLAIKLYEDVLVQNPRDLNSYSSLYTLYVRVKNQMEAENILTRGLIEFPGNPDILEKLGGFYFGLKNYEKAAEFYKSYLDISSNNFEILRNYGVCLYFIKSEKEAIEQLERCMEITFNDPVVLFYLSLCHKKLTDFELAEDFMKAAIEAATPSYVPEMYHHLGQIYGQQRKFAESVEALKESYSQDTTNFEILFEIATTYEEYNFNKTLALNYYRSYLISAGDRAKNVDYALTRIERIKEDLFFEE